MQLVVETGLHLTNRETRWRLALMPLSFDGLPIRRLHNPIPNESATSG